MHWYIRDLVGISLQNMYFVRATFLALVVKREVILFRGKVCHIFYVLKRYSSLLNPWQCVDAKVVDIDISSKHLYVNEILHSPVSQIISGTVINICS